MTVLRKISFLVLCLTVTFSSVPGFGAGNNVAAAAAKKEFPKESPWVALPLVQSNPKLGSALGAMVAYMHYFDEKSRVSMFGAGGTYTTTDSALVVLFGKTSFDEDRQRLILIAPTGLIRNDYKDYLGSGVPVKTEDKMRALIGRYLYRVKGNWFVGAQGLTSNYELNGETDADEQFLTGLGISGFRTGALGAAVSYDSTDKDNSPTRGCVFEAGQFAHREWIAGDQNYDAYNLGIRGYLSHGKGHVFAARLYNKFTDDAPVSGQARIMQRGYKSGQYLGKNMSLVEGEERYSLSRAWRATVFFGVGCLYGDGKVCTESENLFPSGGGGLQYVLKEKEGIVANLEYAQGESDNYGLYLKMGYSY